MAEKQTKRLTNLRVTHVSYVTKGANKKQFFLVKSDDKQDNDSEVEFNVKILKFNQNNLKGIIYGVVAEPESVDTQGHVISEEEIEKAAHKFIEHFRKIDEMHDFVEGAGKLVESFIAPVDMVVNNESIKKGSWVIATKATDEICQKIVDGTYTGYSLAGLAFAEDIKKTDSNNEPETKQEQIDIIKGMFNQLKEAEQNSFYHNAYILLDAGYYILCDEKYSPDEKKAMLIEAIDEFRKYVEGIVITKADDNKTTEQTQTDTSNFVTKDELEQIISKVNSIAEKFDTTISDINNNLSSVKNELLSKIEVGNGDIKTVVKPQQVVKINKDSNPIIENGLY